MLHLKVFFSGSNLTTYSFKAARETNLKNKTDSPSLSFLSYFISLKNSFYKFILIIIAECFCMVSLLCNILSGKNDKLSGKYNEKYGRKSILSSFYGIKYGKNDILSLLNDKKYGKNPILSILSLILSILYDVLYGKNDIQYGKYHIKYGNAIFLSLSYHKYIWNYLPGGYLTRCHRAPINT